MILMFTLLTIFSVGCVILGFLISTAALGFYIPPIFSLAPLGLVFIFLLAAIWRYYLWKSTVYVVTTHKIYSKKGVFGRNISQVSHHQVANSKYFQSWHERLLSYGDIGIFTSGTDSSELDMVNIPDPQHVKNIIDAYTNFHVNNSQQRQQPQSQPSNQSSPNSSGNASSSQGGEGQQPPAQNQPQQTDPDSEYKSHTLE